MRTTNILEINDSFLGWTDREKDPKQKARKEKYLCNYTRADKIRMQRRDFVLHAMIDGYFPTAEEKPNRPGEYDYLLVSRENHTYYIVSKTEYDFAHYIEFYQFYIEENLEHCLKYEKREKMKEKREKEEAEREAREAEEKANQEKLEWQRWFMTELKTYGDVEKIELLKKVFGDLYTTRSEELLVSIENFDNKYCKQIVIDMCGNTDNKLSRKLFYHLTGLKIPTGNKKSREFLQSISSADFVGYVPYIEKETNKDKVKESEEQQYYIYDTQMGCFRPQMGKPYKNKYDMECFIHRGISGNWCISEVTTGCRIALAKTKKECEQKFKDTCEMNGAEKMHVAIEKTLERTGISPLIEQREREAKERMVC